MSGGDSYFRNNNFDLVRLIAASQVLITHGIDHLRIDCPWYWGFVYYFPGVPSFFFISGFLISASWERNPDLRDFATNRFLRIFPALWLVFFFSFFLVLVFDAGLNPSLHIGGLLAWAAAHLTVLQDWNPPFLRSFGVGAINGSLWTIPVELCFYIATPLIYWAGRRIRSLDATLITMVILSYVLQVVLTNMNAANHGGLVVKLLLATPLPWIGMFCVGVLAQRHMDKLYPIIAGRFWIFFMIYVLAAFVAAHVSYYPIFGATLNSAGIVNYTAMIGLILSFAYTFRGLADRVLRRNDFSYGIYIFHMPVINALIALRILGAYSLTAAVLLTVLCATLSWILVERPALARRPRALYRHNARAMQDGSYS